MGRKEDRRRNRALGISNKKIPDKPIEMLDGTLLIPVNSPELAATNIGVMTPAEFYRTTAVLSDKEMNRII